MLNLKKQYLILTAAAAAYTVLVLIRHGFESLFDKSLFLSLHTALEIFIIAVAFFIALAGWTAYSGQAGHKLQVSQERFYKAFYTSPCMMAISRYADNRIIDVNEQMASAVGLSRNEIVGRTPREINFWADTKRKDELKNLLNRHGQLTNEEFAYNGPGGEIRDAVISAQLIEVKGERCILAVMHDVTDKKRMEREMARLERLDLVGRMAVGIGHEIRNPLTTVRGYLQCMSYKPEYAGCKQQLDLMLEEIDQANRIITDFLYLAGNKQANRTSQNLNSIIEALAPSIKSDALAGAKTIELDLNPIPNLLLDAKEIEQLLRNLVRNGLEAMPVGGGLTVGTYAEKGCVNLYVKDEGQGINPEVLSQLGTPFISTKHGGTGLGLAMCFCIARRHDADIDIVTGTGGTTVFVKFPVISTEMVS